jgi:hypothetical protein
MKGIAYRCAIVKGAAEALPGARAGRIRTLEIRVRVVRRPGQRGSESRSDWHWWIWDLSFRRVLCWAGRRVFGVLDPVQTFHARRRPNLFRLGGIFTTSGIDRVATGPCRFAGRDCVTPLPRRLQGPAKHARGFAGARAAYGPSSLRPVAPALLASLTLPLLVTICCERILQLLRHGNVSARIIHEKPTKI